MSEHAAPEETTVLLVEDDEAAAHLITANLKRAGATGRIIRAPNGQKALEILARKDKDNALRPKERLILLLDVNMPGVSGLQVLQFMKNNPTLKRIPVIMLTTSDDPMEIEKCYELGCNFFVTKPVDYGKFVNTIKNIALILQIFTIPIYGETP